MSEGDKTDQDQDDDNDDDDVIVKKTSTWNDNDDSEEDDLPNSGVDHVSKSRHPKRIRVDGATVNNKHIVFDDDG